MKRKCFLVFIFLFSLFSKIYCNEQKVVAEQKIVKVGFLTDMPYLMSINLDSGLKEGYGYDYLQMISNFTNWKYEYVFAEWNTLWKKLLAGEIDLMADISYAPERLEKMSFAKFPMGKEIYRLYVLNKNTDISADNLNENLNGKKVGITADTIQVKIFKNWLKSRKINCEIIEYTSESTRNEDFKNGELAAVIELEGSSLKYWDPIVEIGSSDYYLAVAKNRTDILEELNQALETMELVVPDYNSEIFYKYYSHSIVSSRLSKVEKQWLDKRTSIRCGFFNITKNDKEIIEIIMKKILEVLNLQNISIEMMDFFTYGELCSSLKNGNIDVAYPFFSFSNSAEDKEYSIVSNIDSHTISAVTKKGFDVEDANLIGIFSEDSIYYVKSIFPKAKTLRSNSIETLLNAVVDGKINAAVVPDKYIYNIFNTRKDFSKLQAVRISSNFRTAIASKKGEVELYTLLKRGFSLLPPDFIDSTVAKFNRVEVDYSIMTFFRNNIIFVFAIIFFFFIIFVFVLSSEIKKRTLLQNYVREKSLREQLAESLRIQEEHQRKEKELLYLSETDKLTGISNRGAEGKIRQFIEVGTCGVFCLFDVDKFKSINDNFGHIIGDKVLVKIAECMKTVFRDSDIILRLGGDEFAAFLLGINDFNTAEIIIKRFFSEIEKIQIPELGAHKIYVSLGLTFVTSNDKEFESVYKRADSGCYMSKKIQGNAMSLV